MQAFKSMKGSKTPGEFHLIYMMHVARKKRLGGMINLNND